MVEIDAMIIVQGQRRVRRGQIRYVATVVANANGGLLASVVRELFVECEELLQTLLRRPCDARMPDVSRPTISL